MIAPAGQLCATPPTSPFILFGISLCRAVMPDDGFQANEAALTKTVGHQVGVNPRVKIATKKDTPVNGVTGWTSHTDTVLRCYDRKQVVGISNFPRAVGLVRSERPYISIWLYVAQIIPVEQISIDLNDKPVCQDSLAFYEESGLAPIYVDGLSITGPRGGYARAWSSERSHGQ